jgi:hypothetical protein
MMPDGDTWEKWSPGNIWHRMQPTQWGRLNEGSGLPSDVYFSVSDFPELNWSPSAATQTSNNATVVLPIDQTEAHSQP